MRTRKRRNIIIGLLTCIMIVMGIGYAILTQTINITAGGHIKSKFNIYIDSVTPIDIHGSAEAVSEDILEDKLSAAIQADFYNPGDYVDYNVVVKNDGTINAKLSKVNFVLDRDSKYITFSSQNTENRVLNAHSQIEFTVRIKFDEVEHFTTPDETLLSSGEMQLVFTQYEGEAIDDPEVPITPDEPEEKEWMFKVNSNGLITQYNYKYGTKVKVPYEVDGIVVKGIDENSFLAPGEIILASGTVDGDSINAIVILDEDNYDEILTNLLNLFCGGECPPGFTVEDTGYKLLKGQAAFDEYFKDASLDYTESYIFDYDQMDIVEPSYRITSLDLSEATGLEYIEDEAFYTSLGYSEDGECPNTGTGRTTCSIGSLQELILPEGNYTIGDYAFYGNKITKLVVPDGTTSIGPYTFQYNYISDLSLPTSLKNIGYSAFSNNMISNLTLPEELETIQTMAFANNFIKNVNIPTSLTTISDGVFQNNMIEVLEIPSNIKTIGYSAFQNNLISSLTLSEGLTSINASAFYNNMITVLNIPSTVSTIDYSSFANNKINNLTFTNNSQLNSINGNAFQNNAISNLNLPNSLQYINSYAFDKNNLTDLTIPESVSFISDYAFTNNRFSESKDITVLYNNINTLTRFNNNWTRIGFPGSGPTGEKVGCFYVNVLDPSMIVGYDYENSECSKHVVIPSEINNVTISKIGDNAFKDNGILSLELPNTITSIGQYAFYDNFITNITIPASVSTIGDYAFKNNNSEHVTIEANATNLVSRFDTRWTIIFDSTTYNERPICYRYTVSSNVITITDYDEDNCSKNVIIPSEIDGLPVTKISIDAFNDNELNNVIIPEGVELIDQRAFYDNNLKTVMIPSSVETINTNAFALNDFEGSEAIIIKYDENHPINRFTPRWNSIGFPGSGPSTLKAGCFYVNPSNVHQIIGYDYENSECPKNVIIPEYLNNYLITSIGDNAFQNNNLTGLTLTNNIVTIGKNAFKDNYIESVTIPSSVTTIEISAFENNEISSLDFSERSSNIGIKEKAFLQNNLHSVTIPSVANLYTRSFSKNFFESVSYNKNLPNGDVWESYGFPTRFNPKKTFDDTCFTVDTTGKKLTSYDPKCGTDVVIPNEIVSGVPIEVIDKYAFANTGISSVVMPNSVKRLESTSFYDNYLTSVTFSNSLEFIDSYSFKYNFLSSLNLPDTVYGIGGEAFRFNLIENLHIPDSFVSAVLSESPLYSHSVHSSFYTFADNLLTSVTIPYTMVNTGLSTFNNNMISEIIIEDSVENPSQLEYFGGFNNNQLTSLYIPSTVRYLASDYIGMVYHRSGDERYNWASTLEHDDQNYLSGYMYNNSFLDTMLFEVEYDLRYISDGDRLNSATFGYNQISSVTFEDTLENPAQVYIIPQYCFQSNLISSLTLPNSVVAVDYSAFSLNLIENLTLSDNLIYIGGYAFANNKMTSLSIPSRVEIIRDNAFSNEIVIYNYLMNPNLFDEYGNRVSNQESFYNLSLYKNGVYNHGSTLSSLTINDSASSPSRLKYIGARAFYYQKLKNVTLPSSVTTLGSSSFFEYDTKTSKSVTTNATILYNDHSSANRLDSQLSAARLNGTITRTRVNY